MAGRAGVGGRCGRFGRPALAFTSISILTCNKENGTSMVKPLEYLTYRGGPGHWSWVLHRLSGIGVFLFLLIHIVDISLIGWGPQSLQPAFVSLSLPRVSRGRSGVGGGGSVPRHQWRPNLYHRLLAGNHGFPPQAQLRGGDRLHHYFHSHGHLHVELRCEVGG